MSAKLTCICFPLLLLFLAVGCINKNEDSTVQRIHSALDSLGNETIPGQQRIHLAVVADSLAVRIGNDTLRLKVMQHIADIYLSMDSFSMAKDNFLRVAALAQKLQDQSVTGAAWNNIGYLYDEAGIPDSALKYYTDAGAAYLKAKQQWHYAQTLINSSIIYKMQGHYETSVRLNIEAIKILEQLDAKTDLSDALTTLGNNFKSTGRYDDAIEYHTRALRLREATQDSVGIAGSLNNLGTAYRYQKNYTKAIEHYEKALVIKEKTGTPKSIAISLDNLGEAYLDQNNYTKAQPYFLQALALRKGTGDTSGYLTSANHLSKLLAATGHLAEAEQIALESLGILSNSRYRQLQFDNAVILRDIYKKKGNLQQSLHYATLTLDLKDSLISLNRDRSISDMQFKYESAIKEARISRQQAEIKLRASQNNWLTAGISFAALAIAGIGNAYFRIRKQKRIISKQKREIVHNNRNSIQQLISIMGQQGKNGNEAQATANQERLFTLVLLNKLLYEDDNSGETDLQVYLQKLCTAKQESYDIPVVLLMTRPVKKLKTSMLKDIGLLVNELTTNAAKHAFESGTVNKHIQVVVEQEQGLLKIICRDNGKGLPDGFDINAHRGSFGLGFICDLAAQYHGTIHAGNDKGAFFEVSLKI